MGVILYPKSIKAGIQKGCFFFYLKHHPVWTIEYEAENVDHDHLVDDGSGLVTRHARLLLHLHDDPQPGEGHHAHQQV